MIAVWPKQNVGSIMLDKIPIMNQSFTSILPVYFEAGNKRFWVATKSAVRTAPDSASPPAGHGPMLRRSASPDTASHWQDARQSLFFRLSHTWDTRC